MINRNISSVRFFCKGDICGTLKSPPMVRDFSQTQKMMLSATNPISYFGIMRYAVCDSRKHFLVNSYNCNLLTIELC